MIEVSLYGPQPHYFSVRTPYFEPFVHALKELVPAEARAWDDEARVWVVSRNFWDPIAELIGACYEDLVPAFSAEAEAALVELMEDEGADFAAFQILGVRTEAPECVVHAAYAAIMQAHAAADGDDSSLPLAAMVREAYNRICAWRGVEPRHVRDIVRGAAKAKTTPRSSAVDRYFRKRESR